MISKDYLNNLKKAREKFFVKDEYPTDLIRKDILDSWVRSRTFELTPDSVYSPILSPSEFDKRISEDRILYDIATSFIDYLFQFVAGSGFLIIFADKDGYVLKLIGDRDIVDVAAKKDIPLVEGSCRSEQAIGTNAIGTPLYTKEPVQLFADEHFLDLSANWTCSGAPIILNNEILGVVCISGAWDKVHAHTLGMVMAASEAISRQLSLTLANDHLTSMRNQLQTSIDSLHTGTFLLDIDYNVTFVNAATLKNLQFTAEEMIGRSYLDFFPSLDLSKITKNTYDIETTIHGKEENIKCYISIKSVHNSRYSNKETFLISFRRIEYIRELVNKVMGSGARYTFSNIIGKSPELTRAKELAKLVANGNTSVLITGESGTGKELFAQSIHNHSPFAKGPFVAVNCGAFPKELIESELFGYDPGAFTGAKKEGRAGKFELANNGTIFLDEIGDMPFEVQVKLLRVLQEKCVTRIGGKKNIPLNVRVITATNVNLESAIQNQTFRSDLYYRLNVFNLSIPPLSKRGNDVFELAEYFLGKYQNTAYEPISEIDPDVKELFLRYPWPGNIRELENVIERVCILTTNGRLSLDSLPANMLRYTQEPSVSQGSTLSDAPVMPQQMTPEAQTGYLSATETEKQLIIEHITRSSGNIKKAADSLGISRRTLYRKLEKYEINLNKIRFTSS